MKNIYVTVLTLAVLTMSKQAICQKGFSVSVIGTPQVSFLQNSDDNDNNNIHRKATFNGAFGVGGAYSFTAKIGLGLDVLFSLQGQKYETSGKLANQKLDYVKIPIYFLYSANSTRPVSFIGKIGPQLSILANSKLKDGDGNDTNSDTKNLYKSVTFGGMIGAGVQFKLNPNLFLTTLPRFDYDFTNAEDHGNSHWPSGRAKTYNFTTGLEVGLRFLLR